MPANGYGGKAMIIHQYVAKAVQDDAPRAGERDRLLLGAQPGSPYATRPPTKPGVPSWR